MRWRWREVVIAAAVFLAAAVPATLAVFAINLANDAQIEAELEENGNATTYANRAHINKESRCRPLTAEARANCEANEDESARQAQHDEHDLAAQKTTAIWTRYMGAAAIVGTAFGIFGVTLVLLTFWENKRAADAAHDANRAWIEGERPHNIELEYTAEGLELTADIGLVNHGNSPATNVMIVTTLIAVPVKDSGINREGPAPKSKTTIPRSGIERALDERERTHKARGKIVYPGKPDKGIVTAKLGISQIRKAEGAPPENCFNFVTVGISYRFGGKIGRTVTAYLMIIKGHDHLVMAPFNIPENTAHRVSGHTHIELIDTLEGYAT